MRVHYWAQHMPINRFLLLHFGLLFHVIVRLGHSADNVDCKIRYFHLFKILYLIKSNNYNKPNSTVSNFVLTDTFNKFYAVRFGLVIWRFLYLEITRCQETRDADWVTDLTVHFAAHALLDTGNIPLFMKPERHEVTGQNHTVQWQHIDVTSQWGWSR